eukprot:5408005-Prymnesium_polylepis.1
MRERRTATAIVARASVTCEPLTQGPVKPPFGRISIYGRARARPQRARSHRGGRFTFTIKVAKSCFWGVRNRFSTCARV